LHCAEDGVDATVIGHIVSKIRHRRGIDRRHPEGVHAKIHEVVEAATDARQIADPVAVTVLERSRINLIHDRSLPPAQILHPTPVLPCSVRLTASLMINDLWYKNAVFYCLSVATYMDANGDGVGDFQGLLRRLDYLQGMGIT